MKLRRMFSATATIALLFAVGQVSANIIGPGVSLTGTSLDTQDNAGRINIDDANFAALMAGTYQAQSFRFDAGSASSVTPFLAVLTGANIYQVIAVGMLQNVSAGTDQSVNFGGSGLFSLSALTNVYAAIVTFGAPNPIQFSGGSTTDHDNNLSLGGIALGTIVNGLSHPNLGRQYNFEIEVVAVPEPGTLLLLGVGLLGLGAARRRRKV